VTTTIKDLIFQFT